jgi:predicted nucleic acid-binding protein
MIYCFDSSAVVKRYAPERGSAWARRIETPGTEHTVYLGQIGIVEIAAALSRKVRTQELSNDEYEAALRVFLIDVRNEAYVITPLSEPIVKLAVNLTRHHPLRGYDAVHLATALALNNAIISAGMARLVFVAAMRACVQRPRGKGWLPKTRTIIDGDKIE